MKQIFPRPLQKGDSIAILSPATTVKQEYVEGAEERLKKLGYKVKLMPSVLGPADGSYASSMERRLKDLKDALEDSDVRAILCARGGYGAVHLIDKVDTEMLHNDPKWIIGYSDISALHAMMQHAGITSIHAPMAKHLTIEPDDDRSVAALMGILKGDESMTYEVKSHESNVVGEAHGVLRGGNLAVLAGLIGSPYDILTPAEGEDVILFIEDISEAIYSTERMLYHLHLNGALSRIKGLIVGQFTETKADKNFESTHQMIRHRLSEWGLDRVPVAFDFPVGHVSDNMPMVEGAQATLTVSNQGVTLLQKLR